MVPKVKKNKDRQFAVLGLGSFGQSLAQSLTQSGYNVLAFDQDENKVHDAMAYATLAVQGDITDESDMMALDIGNFEVVIIAVGRDFEAALLGAMIAREQGAEYLLVKATGYRQKRIFESMGVDKIVLPEIEMGQRVASNLIRSNVLDFIDISGEYSIAEITPNPEWIGKSLVDAKIRQNYHLNVIAIKNGLEINVSPKPNHIIDGRDILVVIGSNEDVAGTRA